jgi:type II secretory ATPase GspE/PulE/Tfp pilus assembly ATPase PilB-like protein
MAEGGKQLPLVALAGKQVVPAVLAIIPENTASKFEVIAYEQTDTHLMLAVVHPENLKDNFYAALENIGSKIGRKIELSQVSEADFKELIAQYKNSVVKPTLPQPPTETQKQGVQKVVVVSPPSAQAEVKSAPMVVPNHLEPATGEVEANGWPASPPPPLFELGKLVAYNYLKRIPLEFAKKHHVLSVDYLKPNTYWFVSDGTNNQALKKVISYMQETNHITAHVLTIKPAEFADLMAYYEMLAGQEAKEVVEEEKKKEELEKAQEEELIEKKLQELNSPVTNDELPRKVAKDVIVPEIQAKILTNEEEKTGLAGLFQKVAQTFVAQDVEKKLPPEPVFNQVVLPSAAAAPVPVAPSSPAPATTQVPAPVSPAPAPVVSASTPTPTPKPTLSSPQSKSKTADDGEDIGKLLEAQIKNLDELKAIIKGGAIPRMVAAVVSFAIHEKASDIHIESFEDEVRVRYRIDGQLMDIIKLPPDVHNSLVSRIKILSRLRLDENRVPQDGRFDVNFSEEIQIDVRVSVMPTVHGEKVVMRILDKSRGIASLEKLGIDGMAYNSLTQAIQKPYGICLATGPTGSGKSTSLYAILQRIATPNVNVVTLEDPIEYEMKGINQSQIRPKIGYTFAEGLRSILRQDPNIIMVGEIRDGETANMATQSALTGHLVLSTLHTNDAAGAIPRLTNMGIEPFLITSSLNVVMAQRLVRKICPDCRKEINLPSGIRTQLEADVEVIAQMNELDARRIKKPVTFYQGAGCSTCNGKGYLGRIGIYEVLPMNDEIADLTIAREPSGRILEQAKKQGMLTLYQDGLLKAINGITTIDEVLRESTNK